MAKSKLSAGLLMYRCVANRLEVLLAHPGGPFFQKKDAGVWTIPKGEILEEEDALAAAQREFQEETGIEPCGPFVPLSTIQQKGGKRVHAWAFEGACDPSKIVSNTFQIEWPPKSGELVEFPEIDRAEFFGFDEAKLKINPAQASLIDELQSQLPS